MTDDTRQSAGGALTHVTGAPVAGSLAGLPVVFTHLPRAAGAALD